MAEPEGIKRLAPKRKCKFNDDWKRDYAWIAKLSDTRVQHYTQYCCQRAYIVRGESEMWEASVTVM